MIGAIRQEKAAEAEEYIKYQEELAKLRANPPKRLLFVRWLYATGRISERSE